MSSSATSDSSLHSRPDKRPATPDHSPVKRARPGLDSPWSNPATPDVPPSGLPAPTGQDASDRVQLPSLASAFNDRLDSRRASLPTLYPDSADSRPRLPYPIHRSTQSSSGLSSYQFPGGDPSDPAFDKPARPRLETDTQVGLYPGPVSDLSLSSAALSSASNSSFGFSPGPLSSSEFSAVSSRSGISPSGLSDADWSATSIPRPNSTPGSGAKYDDSVRHSQLNGPQSMFGGVTRISGQADRSPISRLNPSNGNGIKTESDWSFPTGAPEFNMSPSTSASGLAASAGANPSINVTNSPSRSPQAVPSSNPSLVDRPPQRKRGKLPKPVTDFLKDWLHRHSDHPYPSEEEKKQLCHATGLSMSQVSNWMINVSAAHSRRPQQARLTAFDNHPGSASHPRPRAAQHCRPDDDDAVCDALWRRSGHGDAWYARHGWSRCALCYGPHPSHVRRLPPTVLPHVPAVARTRSARAPLSAQHTTYGGHVSLAVLVACDRRQLERPRPPRSRAQPICAL